ncbi:MAG: type III-A CRISPR-associated protein Cas10/Csm1 [Deferribacteraceae bacterium]|jgi:CRISPR-associated protein Csm1|nr:type III-A CRISPR-associated protein Cas10/Csm1 [Deferribacteraceae bacterium]
MLLAKLDGIVIGSLLRDIGKVVCRGGDPRASGEAGVHFAETVPFISGNQDVLDCIRYPHKSDFDAAHLTLPADSPAYIAYTADFISSGADRRDIENADTPADRLQPLESIFNRLNNNDEGKAYSPAFISGNSINFPVEKKRYTEEFYRNLAAELKKKLTLQGEEFYPNFLLGLAESYLSYIPLSAVSSEHSDVSLFDQGKITAALASSIYQYLLERGKTNYREVLYNNRGFLDEKCFLLYTCDTSGIQDFIYLISGEKALKNLRARSFFLEILLEHIIDTILERLRLTRANLIYSGGGHAYIFLANTEETKAVLNETEVEFSKWFLDNFKTDLSVLSAYEECSANDLMNTGGGSYTGIYEKLGKTLSERKLRRYDEAAIKKLNSGKGDHERECKECKRSDVLTGEDICPVCASLRGISSDIATKEKEYFLVKSQKDKRYPPLPGDYTLHAATGAELLGALKEGGVVRFYCRNREYARLSENISPMELNAANLWLGDYSNGGSFEELAEKAEGIKRIAVLRMDVDNMGKAFISGFRHDKYQEKYLTLSRTATLSRRLSIFFKFYLKHILENPDFRLKGENKGGRLATVVYSGGDDVFIVGAWNDCLELAIDINTLFKRYTQGTLTLSAGIGIYGHSYPIARMADETGKMESEAKDAGKNKIALFGDKKSSIYCWDELKEEVIGEKLKPIKAYFEKAKDGETKEQGKTMLNNILTLLNAIDEDKEPINIARLAYLLSRLAPLAKKEYSELYSQLSKNIYEWATDNKNDNRRMLITAITLYLYLERKKHKKE